MKRNIIFSIVFFIGLLIFAYPIISNLLATKEHHTIISRHDEKILQLSNSDIKDEKERAVAYNETLNNTMIPLTDPFADNQEGENYSSYLSVLNIGESLGSIEIPKIDVEIPIFHGTSDKVLQRGVGHLSNTSLPIGGKGTHAVMTGHRGLPSAKMFRHLDELEKGDMFFIRSLDETLAYKVDHIAVVLPNEVELLDIQEDQEFATLITCEPYMINTHRMLVRGVRVAYTPDSEEIEHTTKKNNVEKVTSFIPLWASVAGLLVLILLLILLYRRKLKKVVKANE